MRSSCQPEAAGGLLQPVGQGPGDQLLVPVADLGEVLLFLPAVVPPQGDVGNFTCRYHVNLAKGVSGVTLAEVVIRVYVQRAHEPTAHDVIDDFQSRLQESLEAFTPRPWLQLQVVTSDVTEEVRGEATYVVVRFHTQFWV